MVIRANAVIAWQGPANSIARFKPCAIRGAPTLWAAVRYGIAIETEREDQVFLLAGLDEKMAGEAASSLNLQLAATRSLPGAAPDRGGSGPGGEQGLGRCG